MGLYGQDDEDEKFKQMLGGIIGDGPAPYDTTTGFEQQSLTPPVMPQSAGGGFPGYTPPPAAAAPAYLDHVQGHQFGGADVAMLGGILAALLGGGKHRGDIAGALAGQYGGAVMQANGRADQRNQQIDQYNSQLASKDDPLERWKADMQAKAQVGNMSLRQKELDAQAAREQRIADHQALEDARDPIADATRQHQGFADIDVETSKKKYAAELEMRTKLAKILGKGQFAAPGGKEDDDPVKLLKKKEAQALLDGINNGTIDPTTGKPFPPKADPNDVPVEGDIDPATGKPYTQAALDRLIARRNSKQGIPGADITDQTAYERFVSSSPGNLKHLSDDVSQSAQVQDKIQQLKDLRDQPYSQANRDTYTSIMNYLIGDESKAGSTGVLSGTEYERYLKPMAKYSPKDSPGRQVLNASLLDMPGAIKDVYFDGEDPDGDRLDQLAASFAKGADAKLGAYGIRIKAKKKADPSKEQPIGESSSGIKFSVDKDAEAKFNAGGGFGPGDSTGKPTDGGKKLVTMSKGGVTESHELTPEQIQKALLKGWVMQ